MGKGLFAELLAAEAAKDIDDFDGIIGEIMG